MSIENLAADMLGDEPEERKPEERKAVIIQSLMEREKDLEHASKALK